MAKSPKNRVLYLVFDEDWDCYGRYNTLASAKASVKGADYAYQYMIFEAKKVAETKQPETVWRDVD